MIVQTPAAPQPRSSPLRHPARLVTGAFAAAIAIGTAFLLLPAAREGRGGASFGDAVFTATSAVTVTGLGVVDTAGHWTAFGEGVILALIQLGGIGIMTLASIVLLGLSRRVGLRHRLIAQLETGVLTLGEVRRVIRGVVVISATCEVVVAVVLGLRFLVTYDEPAPRAVWLGVFHSVSAFNNAGFALFPDSLVRFVDDPIVNIAVMAAIVVGGLGVPVLAELAIDRIRWTRWSLHTKLTLATTGVLIAVAWLLVCLFEWTNAESLGGMSVPEKLLAGLFQAVTPRTAGFNTLDYAYLHDTTWLLTSALMFIGAAPASTGGGIRVTTFALLGFVVLSEVRGDRDVSMFSRRVTTTAQRQAVGIAVIAVSVVFAATLALLATGDWGVGEVFFEVTSAFGTVGLTTGITPTLPGAGQALLIALMFAGRVGPLTVGAALALRSRDERYRLPEERPLIG